MSPSSRLRVTEQAPLPPRAFPALLAGLSGIALIVGSWVAVSDQPAFDRQLGWVNIAVAGLVVLGGGGAAYLVEFRRAIRRRYLDVTGAGRS